MERFLEKVENIVEDGKKQKKQKADRKKRKKLTKEEEEELKWKQNEMLAQARKNVGQ